MAVLVDKYDNDKNEPEDPQNDDAESGSEMPVSNEQLENQEHPHYREKVVERVIEREKEDNTLGIISLVTGIAALIMFACCVGVDLVLGIVALVTGIIGHKNDQSYSLAGLIMGAIVVGLNVLAILGFLSMSILDTFFR